MRARRARSTGLRLLVLAAMALASTAAVGHGPNGLPSVPLDQHNVEHVANVPSIGGNSLDFFERVDAAGEASHYAVAANTSNGFDIIDITEPDHPEVVGRYLLSDGNPAAIQDSSAGSNFHAWVSVNPRRNIVALTVEEGVAGVPLGRTLRHNGAVGMQFVDISDVTNPVALGRVNGLDGPHTVRMIGDNHAYTSLNTWIVDYTDPMNPTAFKRAVEGHEFWEDANIPGRMYAGLATSTGRWGMFDITDPGNPVSMGSWSDLRIGAAHEVYPSPDSSYVGIADFTNGQLDATCPGGGVHFYDISGRYAPGATLQTPQRMGTWYAPFSGTTGDASSSNPNHVSCTMHSWQHHAERSLALAGVYGGGTWIFDPSSPTVGGGDYVEYDGARGKTTWGNTLGNVRDAADYVNAAQWLPFDVANVETERYFVVNGSERGLDIYRYTGPMPAKQSRLQFAASPDGSVTGRLDRYAVLTANGFENLPLAGQTVTITAAGQTVTAQTGTTGAFSASLSLPPGETTITVSWAGDADFAPHAATRTVTR